MSRQSIASAATTAAAVSMSVSNATSVGSLIAAAANSQQPTASHYVNGTGSLGRLKYHHKSLDASDEELEYAQVM